MNKILIKLPHKLRSVTDYFFVFCVIDSTSSSSSTASISQTRRETEECMVDINHNNTLITDFVSLIGTFRSDIAH